MRAGHPLTRLGSFGVPDHAPYPLVRSNTPFAREGAAALVGLTALGTPTVTIDDYDVLREIVATSDAIWITAPLAMRRSLDSGEMVALPIFWLPRNGSVTIAAIHLAARALSPLATSLIAEVAAIGARLIADPAA